MPWVRKYQYFWRSVGKIKSRLKSRESRDFDNNLGKVRILSYFVIINVKMYLESKFQLSMPNNDEVQCSEGAGGYSLSLFPIVQCPVVAIVCPMSIYLPIFWLAFKKSTNLFSNLRLFTCSVALKLFLDSLNKKYNNKYKY